MPSVKKIGHGRGDSLSDLATGNNFMAQLPSRFRTTCPILLYYAQLKPFMRAMAICGSLVSKVPLAIQAE
jgi:hypothetical protein